LKVLVAISMLHPRPEGLAMMWSPAVVYAFLADSGGGTGKTFDWTMNKAVVETIGHLSHVVVAGGLTPRNVTEAMGILHPWGVDVSSGVEASPGKKDPAKVQAFIAAVRQAEKVV
jgi:phosphoribosylanthranilate isomerase